MDDGSKGAAKMTAGLDLGDKYSYLCLLDDESGEVIEEGRLRTTPEAIRRRFDSEQQPLCIAIEVGTHSPWVSRLLEECGHLRSWLQTPESSTSSTLEQAQNRQARRTEPGPAGPSRSQAFVSARAPQ